MGCIKRGPKKVLRKDALEPTKIYAEGGKVGLYENIHRKRRRIAEGSGEKMRRPGTSGAPTVEAFNRSALTAKR
jgi:hypothetical protein